MQKKLYSILILIFVVFSINLSNLFSYSVYNYTYKGNYQRTGYLESNVKSNTIKAWVNKSISEAREICFIKDKLVVVTKDNKIYALNERTSNIEWEYKIYTQITSKLTYNEEKLYFGTYEGKIVCLNWATGKEIWSYPIFGSIYTSPLIIDNSLIFGSLNGKLYSFDKLSGGKLWEYNSGSSIESSPAYDGRNIVFCNTRGYIYYLSPNGKLIWSYNSNNTIVTTSLILDKSIVANTYEGSLLSLDYNGKLLWCSKISPYTKYPPVSHGGIIYQLCSDGLLYAYNSTNGLQLWYSGLNKGKATPIITNNYLIYPSGDKWLNLIDKQNGKKIMQFEELYEDIIDFTVSSKYLFYLTGTSKIYAFETF